MTDTDAPIDYHAHVYFDADTVDAARALCEAARDRFDLRMGRVHEKQVGPHPMWSCQLTVPTDRFGEVIPWLNANRGGLIVFVHPNTGNDLRDHRDLTMWLGKSVPLKLDMFLK